MESEHDDSTGSIGFDGRGHEQLGLTTRHDPAEGTEAQQEARQAAEVEQEQVRAQGEEAGEEQGQESDTIAHGQDHDAIRQNDPPSEGGRKWRASKQGRARDGGESPEETAREAVGEGKESRDLHELLAPVSARKGCVIRDRWALIVGDCREILPLLSPVDHVITDPPYEEQSHTGQRRIRSGVSGPDWKAGKGRMKGMETVPIPFPCIDELTRLICCIEWGRLASRWCLVFCQIEGAHIWAATGKRHGLRHIRTGIWIKPDGMPSLGGDRPGCGYEGIEIMHSHKTTRWNAGGRRGVWVCGTRWRPENEQSYRRGGREGADDHETVKPLTLMMELLENFTDPNDLILDPFAGSATTGVAALRLGRRVILIERDERYAKLCVERMTAEEAGSTLHAARAKQMPLYGAT